jgi:sulfite exporter TauE/SafE
VNELTLLGGLLLGLASSLHCAGMCAGISGSLMMLAPPGEAAWRVAVPLQAGRVASYVTAGGLVGGFGAGVFGLLEQGTAYRLMQWAGAAALAWAGLSLLGVVPPLRALDRLAGPLTRIQLRAGYAHGFAARLAAGAAWGLLPCGMVYAALIYALLGGSAWIGAMVMAGFGLGTVPAVMLAGLGVRRLRHGGVAARGRRLAGAALLMVAGATLLVHPGADGPLCLTP